ncbi:radial spoke head protein 6 homolog A isoform X1 [Nothobranchius furzeri]|uniref:Radial spoke head 4 homolog A n=2 Tax=Nothobranchius furzeri TaxID=105023 RepID=A0A1A8AXB7_NOTFU|nr:radial spoke head protein 6-like protein A-like [Nothobranchius furzeri]
MAVPEMTAERQASSFKAFLLRSNGTEGRNLYDHLTDLLLKVMEERPENAVDTFEKMSLELKEDSLKITESTLRDLPDPSAAAAELEQQRLLFSPPADTTVNEELEETALSNVNKTAFYLEEAGVGLSRQEMQKIFLALRQLVEQEKPQQCRLWGKILGTESNYIVAETPHEEEVEQELSTEEQTEEEMENVDEEKDPLPRSVYTRPPVAPKEAAGTGANKFVYYVCNKPGQAWVRLPSVSPAQIAVARQINRFFTGRLDSVVLSYPPFPGNEANYLRAQIARISAGTQISPFDFYQLIEKESDEENEALLNNYEINADFEGISASEMVKDMANWVHHAYHILPQGRCTWVNLAANLDTEEEDEEANEPEPEVGPPILTAVSHDAEMFDCPPWSSWLSSTLTPHYALAVLRSVLWPGAYACAHAKEFVNIYIGRGLKCVGEEYSPPLPPPPQEEYPIGSEVTEELDPQVEEEQALSLEGQQEASEGTVESEEDDEDEDDD